MINRLFVYGTLAPGRENEHMLREVPGAWEAASTPGYLYPNGWGAAEGYPGIDLCEEAAPVPGLLFTSSELSQHWDRLDEFEGEGYQRVLTRVHREDGTELEAYVYALSEAPPRP